MLPTVEECRAVYGVTTNADSLAGMTARRQKQKQKAKGSEKPQAEAEAKS